VFHVRSSTGAIASSSSSSDSPHVVARHFAVVDGVDLFRAVSTCSESSSLSTWRSDMSIAVSTEHLTVVTPEGLLTVDRTGCFFLSSLALLFGHVF
jgi:hypothetical protein